MDDMNFALILSGRSEEQDCKEANLRDYLSNRFSPHEINFATASLIFSCNWLARNRDALVRVGKWNENAGSIENSILLALRSLVIITSAEEWENIPEIPLDSVIVIAQKFLEDQK